MRSDWLMVLCDIFCVKCHFLINLAADTYHLNPSPSLMPFLVLALPDLLLSNIIKSVVRLIASHVNFEGQSLRLK